MNQLQARIEGIMRQACQQIATAMQGATAMELAGISFGPTTQAVAPRAPAQKTTAAAPRGKGLSRTEITAKVLEVINGAKEPLGLSAISKALRMDPDKVVPSLMALRERSAIVKHGERRNTVYTSVHQPDQMPAPPESSASANDATPPPVPESVIEHNDPATEIDASTMTPEATGATTTNRFQKKAKKSAEA